MEKGSKHNFTSKQEFKSFFNPMESFSWEKLKKVQGKGFEPLDLFSDKKGTKISIYRRTVF
jgi:hypothetical protein